MSLIFQDLSQSLQTGFIDQLIHSNKEYLPQFLVNDHENGKKVLSTLQKQLRKCDEFWFSVAFVTTSGLATLMNTLIDLEKKGIKGKILVSQYLNFTQPEALKRLMQFENIELKIVTDGDFHSKGYLFKNGELYDLIIGSSNLTAGALCSNKEWNLKVSATPVSDIIYNALKEFSSEFKKATTVTQDFLRNYEDLYRKQSQLNREIQEKIEPKILPEITPNRMQIVAISNIKALRSNGKNKALLISATGTGKTYLSAFDVKEFKPERFLFIVHRTNIAATAMKAFQRIFLEGKSMGLYSGNNKEMDKDFIFSTVQTISKKENLAKFNPAHFDYIVIDESHRAGAESYQRILNYFKPKFLLGMTATPERTDGLDIFKLYDHNIAYEIRLHQALEENMLSPFHYYGVTDITVNGELLKENSNFSLLTSNERVNRILEKANLYGCDNGIVRGLIFCSKIEECKKLSEEFNLRGLKTIALSGENSEMDRISAINLLETENLDEKLDYIFTVDIFNEGIDIPKVNQIIMLRPTQSAIVFVQQLGRGLRKTDNKEYLTIIDFIGNYNNNYMVPIALYGDTTYNKDSLRKMMASGSNLLPGASTINFDQISKDRIFEAIDNANMQQKRDLLKEYNLLKFQLGKIPMMMDFIKLGSRDPQLYVNYSKSYFNFVLSQEESLKDILNQLQLKLLELFSNEINNSKRIEESLILRELIHYKSLEVSVLKVLIHDHYGYQVTDKTIESSIQNLNFEFVTENKDKKLLSVGEIYNLSIIKKSRDKITFAPSFSSLLENDTFKQFLLDSINYSIQTFDSLYDQDKYCNGFVLYRKYSRKDVFRILNWPKNPLAQNVGGYIISEDKSNCPIFVNYHKGEDISETTKYKDGFINNYEFEWMSKSKRTLNSPDVKAILNAKDKLRLPLFIKKHNDEGTEFYYMGDVTPLENSAHLTTMEDTNVSVVKMIFLMEHPVEDGIYDYITNKGLN